MTSSSFRRCARGSSEGRDRPALALVDQKLVTCPSGIAVIARLLMSSRARMGRALEARHAAVRVAEDARHRDRACRTAVRCLVADVDPGVRPAGVVPKQLSPPRTRAPDCVEALSHGMRPPEASGSASAADDGARREGGNPRRHPVPGAAAVSAHGTFTRYQLSKQTSRYFDLMKPVSTTAIRPFSLSSSQSARGASPIALKTLSLRYPSTSTFPANLPARPLGSLRIRRRRRRCSCRSLRFHPRRPHRGRRGRRL